MGAGGSHETPLHRQQLLHTTSLSGANAGGNIRECYSSGRVDGVEYVGGLVARNFDGNVADSFWDSQTSGQTASGGGTGKTTAEMQTAGTFLEAGWDFAGEAANGVQDIWWILDGKGYPRLWWERHGGDPAAPANGQ